LAISTSDLMADLRKQWDVIASFARGMGCEIAILDDFWELGKWYDPKGLALSLN